VVWSGRLGRLERSGRPLIYVLLSAAQINCFRATSVAIYDPPNVAERLVKRGDCDGVFCRGVDSSGGDAIISHAQEQAQGILVAALGMLAGHFGYAEAAESTDEPGAVGEAPWVPKGTMLSAA
jgi:hypothetical protein